MFFAVPHLFLDLPKFLGDLRVVYAGARRTVGGFWCLLFISYIHMHATFLYQMIFQMSGNLFTQQKSQRSLNNRRKAEMRYFGRTVDHCYKSMTETMTKYLKMMLNISNH